MTLGSGLDYKLAGFFYALGWISKFSIWPPTADNEFNFCAFASIKANKKIK